tara:strand:+ start:214 stop:453 length:240 start_codon:yes stop_codon:yes gene_type:complete
MKIQGPMRAVDVLDTLAWLDSRARDNAAAHGTPYSGAYFRAWQWLTAVVLDNPRPTLPWHAEAALIRAQGPEHRLESGR